MDDVALRSARGVAGLLSLFPPAEAERATAAFATWSQLATAHVNDRVAAVGVRAAAVHVPRTCPPLDEVGGRYRAVSRFEKGFPPQLHTGPFRPLLLWGAGDQRARPFAVVSGTNYPSSHARGLVGQLVTELHAAQWGLIAIASHPLGAAATSHALAIGVPVTLVLPTGFRFAFEHQRLIDRVLSHCGNTLSSAFPAEPWTPTAAARAERLTVSLARAVIGLELGATAAAGGQLPAVAAQAGIPVLVPRELGPVALSAGNARPIDAAFLATQLPDAHPTTLRGTQAAAR